MDQQVLAVQQWLNETYSSYDGWVMLEEDGLTGWGTIYGLRRGLQHELGISPMASGFGPATTAAFQEQIGTIRADNPVGENIYRLLSGSLWCKGIAGVPSGGSFTFSSLSSGIKAARSNLGIDNGAVFVDVKLMASLMSMDAYWISGSGGSTAIREVQQWLNGVYSARRDFALIPTDGVASRQVITATLYAIQYEIGMADGVANGNFGPGTRSGIKASATIGLGSVDSTSHYVQLFTGLLRLNGFEETTFSGSFTADIQAVVKEYQSFMELPVTGAGDYGTWCSLLVSCGDTDRATKGFDTSTQLTATTASGAVQAGYTHVGRYLVGSNQYITSNELRALKSSGLYLFPIMQRFNNSIETMTRDAGLEQAIDAIERARALDLPAQSTIYYAVDFDPTGDQIEGAVATFFSAINSVHESVLYRGYRVGVYGTRNTCQTLISLGFASSAFVAGMSWGWSGNMGFAMPDDWAYNQIVETSVSLGGVSVNVDKVVVSRHAPVAFLAGVTPPPVSLTGDDPYGTGFDPLYAWSVGAEFAAERASAGFDEIPTQYQINQMILSWLRKPNYWNSGEPSDALWYIYTAESPMAWRESVEAALSRRMDATWVKAISDARDNQHFAAACLGCMQWFEYFTDKAKHSMPDYGGWGLDLLQLWGQYEREGTNQGVRYWMRSMIGAKGKSSSFGYSDLIADVDAWLIGSRLERDKSLSLSDVLRMCYQQLDAQRCFLFFNERFDSSAETLASAFASLVKELRDGKDLMVIPALLAKQAAGITNYPEDDLAAECGYALADVLSSLES